MAFCIPASQYDPELHDIVSGPHSICTGCDPLPSGSRFKFFEISLTNTSILSSHEYKIFIKVDEDVSKLLNRTSGQGFIGMRVVGGSVHYNPTWNFHLDPLSIRFVSLNEMDQVPSDMINLNPSTIEEMVGNGIIPQGTEIFFSFDGKFRQMEISGMTMCQDPLVWTSEPVMERGIYVQMGRCDGNCSQRLSYAGIEYCVDAILEDAENDSRNLIQAIVDSNNNKIEDPSYQIDRQFYIKTIYQRLLDIDEIPIEIEAELESELSNSFNQYVGELEADDE